MIWYNIKGLEDLLINGKLSDKVAFNYLFIHVTLFTVTGYLPEGDGPFWATWAHLIISVVAVVWGVRKTFQINQAGDGKDYFKRFISLSFVAAINTIFVAFGLTFILVIFYFIAEYVFIPSNQFPVWKEIIQLVMYALLNVYYFYILISSFRRINAAGESTGAVEVA
ncbi:hypothetical protein [Salinimicrobium xinjiangense]|uniref:hypothetical protein n=1 Tax=Salinimicrobium xinjiangense TaxID=438596 RepID=UPI00040E8F54|nr:hypothetical protein [Salinimicrobium xinjiangense]